ncbi:hypothetical protein DFH06DRAFT_1408617 [Mycena polygramma]|nr:hypothetical protein DFH06DRAFT_1408617 [Mycena polygramma]
MSIPLPACAGCLLCPCRSTYFMVSAHEGRREPQAHTDLCICEHKYVNHIFLYVPDPANPSPANIKGPNRAQQCGWFIPPRLPIQPTMPCKGCNTPWYHHGDVDMPAMPSTSGPILPQASYPPSDTFFPHILPRASHPPPNTFPPPSSYLPPPATAYRSTVAPPRVEYHTPNPIPESYQPPVPDRGTPICQPPDFSYAGVVQPPTATEVGEIIRGINKGSVRGLELLRLVGGRPRGNGRAFKMGNADEIRAAFCRLHGFLDNKLSAAQKAHMVFDAIMTENSLCKLTRVAGDKDDEFKV